MDAMKSKDGKETLQIVTDVLHVVKACDKNGFFGEMALEGSVKTDTKVSKPNEFDFTWPLKLSDFSLSKSGKALINHLCRYHNHRNGSSCVKRAEWKIRRVKIRRHRYYCCVVSEEERFHDIAESGCIPTRAICEYLHECVVSASKHVDTYMRVRSRIYGPAVRFTIKDKRLKHKIDVDISPRIDVPFKKLPNRMRKAVKRRLESLPRKVQEYVSSGRKLRESNLENLYLVPKYEGCWLLSFANYENLIINMFGLQMKNESKRCFREVKLKLLAWRIKGKSKLTHISSYLLKTIYLEMITEEGRQWSHDHFDDNYKEMLRRLSRCVDDGELRSFFDQDSDLLEKVSRKSLNNLIKYIDEEDITSSEEETDSSSSSDDSDEESDTSSEEETDSSSSSDDSDEESETSSEEETDSSSSSDDSDED